MTPFSISGLMIAATTLPLGLVVFFQRPQDRLNRLYALFILTVFLWGLSSFAIGLPLSRHAALLAWKLAHISIISIPVLCYHVVFLLCNLSSYPGLLLVYSMGGIGLLLAFSQLITGGVRYAFSAFSDAIPGWAYPVFFACWIAVVVAAHYTLWRKFRRATGIERKRLRLFFLGMSLSFVGGSLNLLPVFRFDVYPWGNFAVPLFALFITYAIFVYKLMDIRIVLRRGLVYSTLAALITATYLVLVLIMEKGFQGVFGYRSLIATGLTAFLIAICFNPLRTRIQALVDRALFKATPVELAEQRDHLLTEVRKSEQMKAVGTLAAGLAHEIKNPLAAIKTFTESLNERYDDPTFRVKFQKIVGGEVERINLIVQQLLDFAKPAPPKLTPLEIPKLLDDTLELLNSELLEHHVSLARHYEAGSRILGDPQQLKQVFLNLLLNSLQALNGHGRLSLTTHAQGAELVVTIADNGTGIAPKDLPHLFEPFFTTKETGTGLGLAVVQSIVSEHRGRITVQSTPGEGTSIHLHFPIAVE